MTRTSWSFVYWVGVWAFAGFLIPEILGEFRWSPWNTLSETVWAAERYRFVSSAVFALLLALMAHFLYRRELWVSLLFGVLVAASAHVLDRALP